MPLSSCIFSGTSLPGLLDSKEYGTVSAFDFFMTYDRNLKKSDDKKLHQLIFAFF